MKIELSCKYAEYDSRMRIRCRKAEGELCAHQYFKRCKGWCVLTEGAGSCPLRKESK